MNAPSNGNDGEEYNPFRGKVNLFVKRWAHFRSRRQASSIFVIAGRQRPASIASGSTLPDPVIHSQVQRIPRFIMDRRVKPGDDEY
jgi:hypothetical protein